MHHPPPRSTSSASPGSRSTFWLGAALGLFVGWLCTARAREPRRRDAHRPSPALEAMPPPLPDAVLLASVAGEEDPGAAVDAPAQPRMTRSPSPPV
ncbi:hypothetical protein [Hydrogenophaga sp. BPS33]|uniref:hypothetical protein n=1 Tax=Hydrogenophaga sp. BPS33 TaxID=2651974 RepID=UPI00131FDE67|nr:hypothetical protein [Hydrogenophaga sp. BPS33]QHE85400.1 hypothetical protein F9K07_11065 [Hydrogenophaga sp. BPS33]